MTDTELRRLSALRSLLEGFAARQTAAHPERTARQPERLRAILQRLRTAVRRRDYPTFRTADEELHATVVAAAAVPQLLESWRLVWQALQGFHQKGFDDCFPDTRVLIEEHEHLVETIVTGDPAAAEDAARSHVEAVWFRLAEQQHRADTVPAMQVTHHVVPCTTNPLGVKGAGESGVSGALPSAANAIIHALSERGITRLDMPMSPSAIWEALRRAV